MNILLPTDFSLASSRALEIAGSLLSKGGGKLILLHTYHTPMVDAGLAVSTSSSMLAEVKADAEKNLSQARGQAEGLLRMAPVKVEAQLEAGLAVDVILDKVDQESIDLIVMGTQGADGIEEALLGTVTAEVMERSTAPVLGVPISSSADKLGKLAYATDFSKADSKAITRLKRLMDHFDLELCLVHVEPAGQVEDEEKLLDWYRGEIQSLSKSDKISFHIQQNNSVEEGLQGFIKENNIGIVAMLMRERSIWDRLFHRSHTKKMAYHSQVPVLAMHS